MAITAEWSATYYGYELTSALAGAVSWWKVTNWPDGRVLSIAAGTGNPLRDTMVPTSPGAVTTYYAQAASGAEQITLTPPAFAEPLLNVPSDISQHGSPVVVQTQREYTVTGRTAVYEVLDRDVPWVEPMAPIDRRGQLVLRMEHPGGAFPGNRLRYVREMLRTGQPMLLRTTCNERVETLSFIAESWTEVHVGQPNSHGPDRLIDISWRAVEPLWGEEARPAGVLWFAVPVRYGTWDQVKATGKTWEELAWGAPV